MRGYERSHAVAEENGLAERSPSRVLAGLIEHVFGVVDVLAIGNDVSALALGSTVTAKIPRRDEEPARVPCVHDLAVPALIGFVTAGGNALFQIIIEADRLRQGPAGPQ